jgi:hypothetical protein
MPTYRNIINTGFHLRPLDEEQSIISPESGYSHEITRNMDGN